MSYSRTRPVYNHLPEAVLNKFASHSHVVFVIIPTASRINGFNERRGLEPFGDSALGPPFIASGKYKKEHTKKPRSSTSLYNTSTAACGIARQSIFHRRARRCTPTFLIPKQIQCFDDWLKKCRGKYASLPAYYDIHCNSTRQFHHVLLTQTMTLLLFILNCFSTL